MLKRINNFLNIIMGSAVGVFIGHGIYMFWDYKTRPGFYVMGPAPWYTSILVYGIVTVVVLMAAIFIKLILRRKRKQ